MTAGPAVPAAPGRALRISVLATSRHPLRQPWAGGQEAHTARLVLALRRRGHHVRVHAVAGTDPALADELVAYPELPPLSAVAALDPQLPEPDFLRDHAAFTAAVAHEVARGDADVVHNQSLHHLPLSMSAALPAPTMVTLHTPPFPWMELGIALADERARFVGVSRACLAQWTSLPRPADVVLNGVPDHEDETVAAGDGLVWVGRMTAEKGPDLAVAAARAAGCPLRLVGPVSDPRWYAEHVAPLLGDGVEHVGHLDEPATREVVRHAAVALVTPRWEEPFGLVAAEAAMAGTPVVAVARGGLPEVLGEGAAAVGVLVPPTDDAAEVVDAVAAAVPAAMAMDRAAVREAARARLGEGGMVDAYERIFHEMAAG